MNFALMFALALGIDYLATQLLDVSIWADRFEPKKAARNRITTKSAYEVAGSRAAMG
jgi:hypothetical protein